MKRKFIEFKCKFCAFCANEIEIVEQHIDSEHSYCITCKKRFVDDRKHVQYAASEMISGDDKDVQHLRQVIGHYESFLDKLPIECVARIVDFLPAYKDCLSFNAAYKRWYLDEDYRKRVQCHVMRKDPIYPNFQFVCKQAICEQGVQDLAAVADKCPQQVAHLGLQACIQNNWRFLQRYFGLFKKTLPIDYFLYLLSREPSTFSQMLFTKKMFRTCCVLVVFLAEDQKNARYLFDVPTNETIVSAIPFLVDEFLDISMRNAFISALLNIVEENFVFTLPASVCKYIAHANDFTLARLFLRHPTAFFYFEHQLIEVMAKMDNLPMLRWLLSKECFFKPGKPARFWEHVFASGTIEDRIMAMLKTNTFSLEVSKFLRDTANGRNRK